MKARILPLLCLGLSLAAADAWNWAPVIQVGIEHVVPGEEAPHQKNEHAWALAMARARSPYPFLGMTAVAGGSEAWWIWPLKGFKDLDGLREFPEKDPGLKARVAAIAAKDGHFIDDLGITVYVLRSDLSHGPGTVLPRYYWVFNLQGRPGHDGDFEDFCKQLNAAYDKAGIQPHWCVYQMVAGANAPSWLVMTPLHALGDLEALFAEDAKFAGAVGPDVLKSLNRLEADGLGEEHTLLMAVDPLMSYPDKAEEAADPEFWKGWDKADK